MASVRRGDAAKFHSHWILYLHTVIEAGSIRGAARVLNVAPSAISRRLRELEVLTGDRLLERTPKGFRLTSAGEVVVDHAREVLGGLSRMQLALDELRGLERGHVTIFSVPTTAVELLPKLVAGFLKTYPKITFTCHFLGSSAIVEQVLSGEADIGIAFNPPRLRTLRQVASVPLPFGAIMSPDHALAARKSVRVSELIAANVPLILPDNTISTRSVIESALRKRAVELEPVATSTNRDFVIGMAQFGAGIAIRTTVGIERELRDGSLVFVPLKEPGLKPRLLTAMTHTETTLSSAARLFLESVRAGLAELRS